MVVVSTVTSLRETQADSRDECVARLDVDWRKDALSGSHGKWRHVAARDKDTGGGRHTSAVSHASEAAAVPARRRPPETILCSLVSPSYSLVRTRTNVIQGAHVLGPSDTSHHLTTAPDTVWGAVRFWSTRKRPEIVRVCRGDKDVGMVRRSGVWEHAGRAGSSPRE